MSEEITVNNNANPAETGEKTFTQEQVNKIVADRLARAKISSGDETNYTERLKALEEREKAVTALENANKCKEHLKDLAYSDDVKNTLLEVLDTSDPEKFKQQCEGFSRLFTTKETKSGVKTPNPASVPTPTEDAAIKKAFAPPERK